MKAIHGYYILTHLQGISSVFRLTLLNVSCREQSMQCNVYRRHQNYSRLQHWLLGVVMILVDDCEPLIHTFVYSVISGMKM